MGHDFHQRADMRELLFFGGERAGADGQMVIHGAEYQGTGLFQGLRERRVRALKEAHGHVTGGRIIAQILHCAHEKIDGLEALFLDYIFGQSTFQFFR